MVMKRTIQVFIVLAGLVLAGCDGPPVNTGIAQVKPGTTLYFKAMGRHFKMHATRVHGDFSIWDTYWKDHRVSTHKLYRGFLSVSGDDDEQPFYNELDYSRIEDLFPLTPGRELVLEGTHHSQGTHESYPMRVYLAVGGQETLQVRDTVYDVIRIDIIQELDRPQGVLERRKSVWMSPVLGVPLRTVYENGAEYIDIRVLSINAPHGQDPDSATNPARALGTILI